MANRGNATQQVLKSTPPQPHRLRHAQLLANGAALGMVNVARPLRSILVRSAPQRRKQVEFQMVVRVDQPRQDQMAAKVEVLHTRVHQAASTAGVRRAVSKNASLPARSNRSRSGSPNVASTCSRRSKPSAVNWARL